jgi:hypothetical protein
MSSEIKDLGQFGDERLISVCVDEELVVVDAGPVDGPYKLGGIFDPQTL